MTGQAAERAGSGRLGPIPGGAGSLRARACSRGVHSAARPAETPGPAVPARGLRLAQPGPQTQAEQARGEARCVRGEKPVSNLFFVT